MKKLILGAMMVMSAATANAADIKLNTPGNKRRYAVNGSY